MSSVRANGHSAATSAGEISWSSTPKPRANAASRRSASSRAGVVASEMWPIGRKPVARPVSASSPSYRSREYRLIHREVSSAMPAEVIRPAACQVVPDVSRSRSSRRTSSQPSRVRW